MVQLRKQEWYIFINPTGQTLQENNHEMLCSALTKVHFQLTYVRCLGKCIILVGQRELFSYGFRGFGFAEIKNNDTVFNGNCELKKRYWSVLTVSASDLRVLVGYKTSQRDGDNVSAKSFYQTALECCNVLTDVIAKPK